MRHAKKRFEGKLLVCDMDGTLLDSGRQLSEINSSAIWRFVENGGIFTVATGRNEESVRNFLGELPINAPVIVNNGAAIYDYGKEKVLWESLLDKGEKKIVGEVLEAFPEVAVEVFQGKDIYFARENSETDAHLAREPFTPICATLEQIPLPWTKVIFAAENRVLRVLDDYIRPKYKDKRFVFSERFFLEMLNLNATKGHALEWLAGHLGITIDNTAAVGDNMNDLEMLETAGIGIAVSNAHEALKHSADLCCRHHDEDAVCQVVEWMEEGKLWP